MCGWWIPITILNQSPVATSVTKKKNALYIWKVAPGAHILQHMGHIYLCGCVDDQYLLLISNIASSLIAVSPIPKYHSLIFNKRPWLDWVTRMSEWTQHHVSMPPDIYWALYRTSQETWCQLCGIWHLVFPRPRALNHIRASWMLNWCRITRF